MSATAHLAIVGNGRFRVSITEDGADDVSVVASIRRPDGSWPHAWTRIDEALASVGYRVVDAADESRDMPSRTTFAVERVA